MLESRLVLVTGHVNLLMVAVEYFPVKLKHDVVLSKNHVWLEFLLLIIWYVEQIAGNNDQLTDVLHIYGLQDAQLNFICCFSTEEVNFLLVLRRLVNEDDLCQFTFV